MIGLDDRGVGAVAQVERRPAEARELVVAVERVVHEHLGAARAVAARGWQIFGIAFIFRLQMYVTSLFYRWRSILKVDILNVMGPSIAAAAWTWGLARTTTGKIVALSVPVVLLGTFGVLSAAGFHASHGGAVAQGASALRGILVNYSLVPAVFVLLSLLVIRAYHLKPADLEPTQG